MKKKIIIISNWKSKDDFQQLKANAEQNISDVASFYYLICIDNPKKIEDLPQLPSIYYLSKRDFTILGKIKTPMLRGLLLNESKGVLITAMEEETPLLNKILKQSKLMSIGMEKETLPSFDLSFKDSQLLGGKLFKQINNYLTKIQL